MCNISIFLGSSSSLMKCRTKIGSHIRLLNDTFLMQGVQVTLLKWEDYNTEYSGNSKQQEYDRDLVLKSNIVVTLFKDKIGEWTEHELDVAIADGTKEIYCYCFPCRNSANIVSRLLAKGLKAIEVASICDVTDALTRVVKDYAQCAGMLSNKPRIVASDIKRFYGTIPSDMKQFRDLFSDMMRSLDMITTSYLNTQCTLHPYYTPEKIHETNHYVAIFNTNANATDVAEFESALTDLKSNVSVEAISIFQYKSKSGNIRSSVPAIKKILDDNVIFTIGMHNLDKVRLELLLWCLRKHEASIMPSSSEFRVEDDCVQFFGIPIAAVGSIPELSVVKNLSKQFSDLQTQFQSVSKNEHDQQKALNIKLKMRRVSAEINNQLSLILDDLMNNRYALTTDFDPAIAFDSDEMLAAQDAEIKVLQNISNATDKKLADDENRLRARRDYIQDNISSVEDRIELKKLQDALLKVAERRHQIGSVSGLYLLQEQLHTIGVYDTFLIHYNIPCDEDSLYKQVVENADSLQIIDPTVEMMRLNLGNWHSRNNRNTEAIRCYERAIHNMRDADDKAYIIRQSIVHLYVSCINALNELGEHKRAHNFITELEWYINKWANRMDKTESFVNRARLVATKLRERPIEKSQIGTLYSEARQLSEKLEKLDLSHLPEHVRSEVLCDFICCYGCLVLDYPIDDNWNNEAVANFQLLIKNAEASYLSPDERLDYLSKAHHNIARTYQQFGDICNAQLECLEALRLRRELYKLTEYECDKAKVAETLLLLGATYLKDNCLNYLSETDTEDALAIANECLSLYSSLNTENYLEQQTDVYKAKLLKASIMFDSVNNIYRHKAIALLCDCFNWNIKHLGNSYSEVLFCESRWRLASAGKSR